MMISITLAATALSVTLLILLAFGDPKRRRAAGLYGGHGRAKRYCYAAATLLPGVLLALTGNAAMWLIWFGGCAVAGWLITLWLGRPSIHD